MFVGISPSMVEIHQSIDRMVSCSSTPLIVLLLGETGSGKGAFAS